MEIENGDVCEAAQRTGHQSKVFGQTAKVFSSFIECVVFMAWLKFKTCIRRTEFALASGALPSGSAAAISAVFSSGFWLRCEGPRQIMIERRVNGECRRRHSPAQNERTRQTVRRVFKHKNERDSSGRGLRNMYIIATAGHLFLATHRGK